MDLFKDQILSSVYPYTKINSLILRLYERVERCGLDRLSQGPVIPSSLQGVHNGWKMLKALFSHFWMVHGLTHIISETQRFTTGYAYASSFLLVPVYTHSLMLDPQVLMEKLVKP